MTILFLGLVIFILIALSTLLVITACMFGSRVSQEEEAFQ